MSLLQGCPPMAAPATCYGILPQYDNTWGTPAWDVKDGELSITNETDDPQEFEVTDDNGTQTVTVAANSTLVMAVVAVVAQIKVQRSAKKEGKK